MNRIRNFDEFNEGVIGDFFRKKSNKDEDTAMGILKSISDDLSIFKESDSDHGGITTSYSTDIDGFSILIKNFWIPMGDDFILYVDNVDLECSNIIMNKIYKSLEDTYRREQLKIVPDEDIKKKEDEEYIKKDARIRFSK
jgi:hypothetical protein